MRRFLLLLFLPALMTTALAQQRGASITSIAPTFGPPGTTVSIRGKGFAGFEPGSPWVKDLATEAPPGLVEFNGVPGDVLFWEDDLITVKVPKHASTGVIRIVLLESRTVLAGDFFEVYYSMSEETQNQNPVAGRESNSRDARAVRRDQWPQRSALFDGRSSEFPLYMNPWFSSLSPGERTFFSENGFWLGSPFSVGRRGSGFFCSSGFLPLRKLGRLGVGGFVFNDPFLPRFTFRSPHSFGFRPFGLFFDRNRPSGRNEGHNQGNIFRR